VQARTSDCIHALTFSVLGAVPSKNMQSTRRVSWFIPVVSCCLSCYFKKLEIITKWHFI